MVARSIVVGGVDIPKLGIGTWGLFDDTCRRVVREGLALGYRHVDTAEKYQNEAAVGDGVRGSGLARDEIFLTTKVWYDHVAGSMVQAAAEASLGRLKLDYVDLFLIHWPNPDVPLAETIEALNDVKARGLARAIGVSNFPSALVAEAAAISAHPLAVNQVEYHPYLDQSAVLGEAERLGMGVTAYCPLARGRIVKEPIVLEIAERHDVAPATIAIAWLVNQERVIAIPKSSKLERLSDNLAALDIVLSAQEIAAISALAYPGGRLVSPDFAPNWDDAAA